MKQIFDTYCFSDRNESLSLFFNHNNDINVSTAGV